MTRDLGSGYVQQWNLAVQRELGSNLAVEVAYAGSKGTHIGVPDTNINQLTVEQLALGNALLQRVPNPCFGEVPPSSSLATATVPRAQVLRPFPCFNTVSLYRNNVGNTSYNALEVKLEKRFSHGLSALVSYTWSKLIDTASSVFDASILAGPVANFPVADSYNPRLERDVSTGDIPHNFVASFVWDLPWGRGRTIRAPRSGRRPAERLAARRHRHPAVGRARRDHPGHELQRVRGLRHAAAQPSSPIPPCPRRSAARRGGSTPTPSRWRRSSPWATARATRCAGPATRTSTWPSSSGRRSGSGRTTLEFRVEAFNLTNTPPLGAPNGVLGAPGFGSITSAGDPRVVQLGLKVIF